MKHLIIYSHPNPKSFNHAIKETFQEALTENGNEVRIRDLYDLGFDPVLKAKDFESFQRKEMPSDIKEEQEHIKWADILTFIFPLWWCGLPAIAKGYVDRVLSEGFAYTADAKGLLPDKKVFFITTMGAPNSVYEKIGLVKSMHQVIDAGMFQFCAMKVIGGEFLGSIHAITDMDRKKMLDDVRKMAADLK